jgi:hypothetical protein
VQDLPTGFIVSAFRWASLPSSLAQRGMFRSVSAPSSLRTWPGARGRRRRPPSSVELPITRRGRTVCGVSHVWHAPRACHGHPHERPRHAGITPLVPRVVLGLGVDVLGPRRIVLERWDRGLQKNGLFLAPRPPQRCVWSFQRLFELLNLIRDLVLAASVGGARRERQAQEAAC